MPNFAANHNPGLIQPEKSVLVIVDVQEKLFPSIWKKEEVQRNIVRLARFCSIMDIPVLVCEQIKLGETIKAIQQEVTDFQPLGKETFSCFGADSFQKALAASGKEQLIVAGIESHVCVLQTAIQAAEQKYRVQVVMDATSSRFETDYWLARDRLLQSGVIVSSTEMLFFEAMQRAGTDRFKEVLPLVK